MTNQVCLDQDQAFQVYSEALNVTQEKDLRSNYCNGSYEDTMACMEKAVEQFPQCNICMPACTENLFQVNFFIIYVKVNPSSM